VAEALRDALGEGDATADGLVYVAADPAPPDRSPASADLFDRQLTAAVEVLDLLKVMPGPLPAGVCVVTASAQAVGEDHGPLDLARAPLWGLLRVAMKERPDAKWQLVDLPPSPTAADIDQLASLLAGAGPAEDETAIRGGRRVVRRLRRLPPSAVAGVPTRPATPSDCWRADVRRPGALETCALRPAVRRRPGAGQVEVEVDAAGLNFRDVVLAMGLLPSLAFDGTFGEQALGLDLAGRVVAVGDSVDGLAIGDAVFGISPGTMASHSTTAAELVTLRPPGLSAVDAAASPCAFVTALYALDRQARLIAGERVLIHSATGGVGLAAIQIARRAGAEIIATAGSEAKRDLLRSMGIAHIFDSRRLDFADEVLEVTGGQGVDVVLNSLSGEAIARGIATLAPFGRFVELGKRDIYDDANLGLLAFRRNLSFFAVDLDRLCRERPQVAGGLLREVAAMLAAGSLEPLPVLTFPVVETGTAIRHMAQARHTGKIVLEVAGAGPEIEAPVRRCRPDGTYLVSGGTGGFGLATAGWLVEQGAGAVVIVARHPPDEATAARLGELEAIGARIVAMAADVGDEADVARVLEEIGRTLPPLRGVVHAAMVLDDATLGELDRGRLERNMHAKVLGAWNLHRLTKDADLDLFVCFSSIAALLGNTGQGGYAAANAFLQALAHHRRSEGRPALTVDWGVISDVGYVARRPDLARHLDRHGYRSFSPTEAFACMERLLDLDLAQGMAARVDWRRLAAAAPDELRSSRLGHFRPVEGETRGAATVALTELLALTGEERLPALVEVLRTEVAAVLGVSPARVELDRPLPDLGFDSLIAVELAAVVQLRLGIELPLVRLLQDATVNGLAALVLDLAGDAPPSAERAAPIAPPPPTHRPEPVPAAPAPITPAPVRADVPEPPPAANGPASRYESLDYRRWSPVQRAIKTTISAALRTVASIEVEDGHHLDTPGPYILVLNHMALVDVPLVLTVMPRPVIVLAASEYRSNRITDWFLSDKGNAIYVDRGAGDIDALDQALIVLRAGGIVGLSPEGRRSHTGALERAHNGVSHLAAKARVPVVPMAVWGQEAIRQTLRHGRRSPVNVRVGPPIPPPAADAKPSDLLFFTTGVMATLASMLPERYRGVYADEVVTGSGA
jgi:1-acyl-sn-glycerol-3-phosphate acyltransferase